MNELLNRAMDEARTLPDDIQEVLGATLMEAIEAERGWEKRFSETPDVLSRLAAQAREDEKSGRVMDLDPGDLNDSSEIPEV